MWPLWAACGCSVCFVLFVPVTKAARGRAGVGQGGGGSRVRFAVILSRLGALSISQAATLRLKLRFMVCV